MFLQNQKLVSNVKQQFHGRNFLVPFIISNDSYQQFNFCYRPVETEIFAEVDLLPIGNNSEKKKGAKKQTDQKQIKFLKNYW